MDDGEVVQLIAVIRSKKEISESHGFFRTRIQLGKSIDIGIGIAEASVISVLSEVWIEVTDRGKDRLIFVTQLVAVAAMEPGVVQLRVEDMRVLKLGIAPLASKLRVTVYALIV